MGRAIAVDANAGIFVTLNPAGKGYGGRSRLPDNLKQLFRCVVPGPAAAHMPKRTHPTTHLASTAYTASQPGTTLP